VSGERSSWSKPGVAKDRAVAKANPIDLFKLIDSGQPFRRGEATLKPKQCSNAGLQALGVKEDSAIRKCIQEHESANQAGGAKGSRLGERTNNLPESLCGVSGP